MPSEEYGDGPGRPAGRAGESPDARGAGRVAPSGGPPGTRGTEPVERVVERMARREAAGHLLVPPSLPLPPGDATPPVGVRRVRCPWCGAEGDDAPAPDGLPGVTLLACESLTNRSLLPVVVARCPPDGGYLTRAAYWAAHAPAEPDDAALIRLIIAVDAAESWADTMDPAGSPAVVPAATRGAGAPGGHFLTPHPGGVRLLERLDLGYRRARLLAVEAAFRV